MICPCRLFLFCEPDAWAPVWMCYSLFYVSRSFCTPVQGYKYLPWVWAWYVSPLQITIVNRNCKNIVSQTRRSLYAFGESLRSWQAVGNSLFQTSIYLYVYIYIYIYHAQPCFVWYWYLGDRYLCLWDKYLCVRDTSSPGPHGPTGPVTVICDCETGICVWEIDISCLRDIDLETSPCVWERHLSLRDREICVRERVICIYNI